MKNKVYIELDERQKVNGIVIGVKTYITTFSHCGQGKHIAKKVKLEDPETGDILKENVIIEIKSKMNGKNIWKGVII